MGSIETEVSYFTLAEKIPERRNKFVFEVVTTVRHTVILSQIEQKNKPNQRTNPSSEGITPSTGT